MLFCKVYMLQQDIYSENVTFSAIYIQEIIFWCCVREGQKPIHPYCLIIFIFMTSKYESFITTLLQLPLSHIVSTV